jgi:phosphotriesterase-related protein
MSLLMTISKKIFRAVVATHKKTGVPILTHTNAGRHAVDQAELFINWVLI